MGPEILAFGSYCLANFTPILDCLKPNFKLNYEDSEDIKADRGNTVVFNLRQIKQRNIFWDTWQISIAISAMLLDSQNNPEKLQSIPSTSI